MMNKVKYWNPKVNDELEGILTDKLENVGIYHSMLYKIKQDDGVVNVWGKSQLDSLMDLAQIGDRILLRYVGVKQVNDYEMKIYELEILNE